MNQQFASLRMTGPIRLALLLLIGDLAWQAVKAGDREQLLAAEDDLIVSDTRAAQATLINGRVLANERVLTARLNPNGEAVRVKAIQIVANGDVHNARIPADRTDSLYGPAFTEAIETRINHLDRCCQLTDVQKQKLQLAGGLDRRNYLQQITNHEGTMANPAGQGNPIVIGANRPARFQSPDRLLGPETFFAKTAATVLTKEQRELLSQSQSSRQSIRMSLEEINRITKLDASQEKAVEEILSRFAARFSQLENDSVIRANSERLAMLYLLSLHSEEQLKPLLSADQWKQAKPALDSFRNLRPTLLELD